MCSGNIIHNVGNCQDIRFMGRLVNFMPLTCVYFNICNLSLCGLPFFRGFYSKDLILEVMRMGYLNFYIYIIFYISIGLTVCYSVRLSYYFILGNFNFVSFNMISERGYLILKGMSGLIFTVVFMGSLLVWVLIPVPYIIILPFYIKVMALFFIFLGGGLVMSFLSFICPIKIFFYLCMGFLDFLLVCEIYL